MTKQKECFQDISRPKGVLIVDDSAFYRTMLRDIVEKGGYNVVGSAADGVDAIELAKQLKPDIVILDLIMPRKDGIETAGALAKGKNPPSVILCTTINNSTVAANAVTNGIKAYIIKPFTEDRVLDVLKNL